MGVVDSAALGQLAAIVEMRGQHFKLEIEDRLKQAHLYQTALPRHAAAHQTSQQALYQMGTREEVNHRQSKGRRRPVGIPIEPDQSRYRLQEQVLPRFVNPGSVVAIAGNFTVDDSRIDSAYRLVIQPEPLHHPGTEILQYHIRFSDQGFDAVQIRRVFQVGGEALFISVDRVKECTFAIQLQFRDIELSAEIAPVRTLNFDDARAQISQAQGRRGTRQKDAEIEYQ